MGKRGQRLARDAGDWVRHWGQGSRGLVGGRQDLTHQPGSIESSVCVCVCGRSEGVCKLREWAQVELAGILPDIFVFCVLPLSFCPPQFCSLICGGFFISFQ